MARPAFRRLIRSIGAFVVISVVMASLAGCGSDEPQRLAFVACLSDKHADFQASGRNGVLMALEHYNRKPNPHPLELYVHDCPTSVAQAEQLLGSLKSQHIEAVIGPMLSTTATLMVPAANREEIVLISPTVTSSAFTALDDQLVRVSADTQQYARASALFLRDRLLRTRVAVLVDINNAAFSLDWLKHFQAAYTQSADQEVLRFDFDSSTAVDYVDLVRRAIASQPSVLIIVAPAVDTARIAQVVRRKTSILPLMSSHWAGTETLIELGGSAVEGMLMAQFYRTAHASPAFREFSVAFEQRFKKQLSYPALASYDATNVFIDANAKRKKGESLKQAILKQGRFSGIMHTIEFDQYADSVPPMAMTIIRGGDYDVIE